jgi:hypothetical protein
VDIYGNVAAAQCFVSGDILLVGRVAMPLLQLPWIYMLANQTWLTPTFPEKTRISIAA